MRDGNSRSMHAPLKIPFRSEPVRCTRVGRSQRMRYVATEYALAHRTIDVDEVSNAGSTVPIVHAVSVIFSSGDNNNLASIEHVYSGV